MSGHSKKRRTRLSVPEDSISLGFRSTMQIKTYVAWRHPVPQKLGRVYPVRQLLKHGQGVDAKMVYLDKSPKTAIYSRSTLI